jgi:hypothetical protein
MKVRSSVGRLFALVLLFAALSAPRILAQSSASLSGLVTDPSGSVVANAQITLANEQTGTALHVTSDGTGFYTVPFLQPGNYTLSADASGFRGFSKNAINVAIAAKLSIDIHLEVGSASDSVTVNGNGIEINTTDGSVSTVVDQQFVANIPLNGRSFQDLISLAPGVTTNTPQESGFLGSTGDFSINGQRTESNGYVVDGVSANFSAGNGSFLGNGAGIVPAATALGTTQALMSVDDLQELRILSSSYSAEYGGSAGGQLSFSTRSGTNDLHGTLYDYLRNDAFDANAWFNGFVGQPKPPLRQNDFGGTFGGPVRIPKLYNGKDKTFFFLSYEGLRLIQPQAAEIDSVPDLNLRSSAVAAIQPILNALPIPNMPEEMVACSGSGAASETTPYPCPGSSPAGTLVASGLAEFSKAYSLPSNLNNYSLRLDQNINSRMSVFFRFSDTPSAIESRQNYSALTGNSSNTQTYTLGVTNQLSNNITNSLRLGYGHSAMYTNGKVDSFGGATPTDYAADAGLAGYPNPEPDFITLIPQTTNVVFFISNNFQRSAQWNLVDTVGLTKGRHQLKFGLNYRRWTSVLANYNPLVFPFFDNSWEIQNDLPNYFEIDDYQPGQPLFKQYSLFGQDEWRLAPRFSLSMGLRWEVAPPPTAASGLPAFAVTGSISDPSSFAVAPRGTALWKTPYLNFAPRLGVAYQARTHSGWETVVRAGGGVFFDSDDWVASQAYQGIGFLGSFVCAAANTCGFPATQAEINAALPSAAPPYTNTKAYGFPTHLQLPYSLQWNASVQQALGSDQSVTLAYIGSVGRRLPNYQYSNVNSFNPNFDQVATLLNGIHSNYNALEASYQRKLSRGVQALASYTWSHSLDNISEGTGLVLLELLPKYANSDLDVRHNFVAGVSWELPAAKYNAITNAALSHWGLDARFTDRTGFPVPILGSTSELTGPGGYQYYTGIALNSGVPLYLYGAGCQTYYIAHGNPDNGHSCPGGRAINPAAFSSTGSLSNPAPRNIARGFGENQINLALRREFPIHENIKFQFRAEAFNLLNHPNFGGINQTLTARRFGQATATLNNSLGVVSALYQQGGARSMQFALKLLF